MLNKEELEKLSIEELKELSDKYWLYVKKIEAIMKVKEIWGIRNETRKK